MGNARSLIKNLLGVVGIGVHNIRDEKVGVYQRPSYVETQEEINQIQQRLERLSEDELIRVVTEEIPSKLHEIASQKAGLRSIVSINSLSMQAGFEIRRRDKLANDPEAVIDYMTRYCQPTSEKAKSLARVCTVAENLSYAVAFSKGLFGPNDLGYVGDQTVSLPRMEEIVVDRVNRAFNLLKEDSTVFGDNTGVIYNGIVNRLEENRRTFNGVRVNATSFPQL